MKRDESHLGATIINVRREDYEAKLKRLKTELLMAQAGLESGEADALVRVNVLIYPPR